MNFTLIIQVIAVLFLSFEAFGLFAGLSRPRWGWFGLALWLLSLILGGLMLHAAR